MEAKESPYYLGNRDCVPTLLSLKTDNKVINIELPWDAGLDDLLDAFYGALVSMTFHPEIVIEGMYEYSKEKLPKEETEEEYDQE